MAAGGQKTLTAKIRLLGELGSTSGFKQISDVLQDLNDQVQGFSSAAKSVLGDSAQVYRSYETEMLAARGALGTTIKSTTELNSAMDQLDKAAQEWAASTIFHTNDVAQAINEAAHAGWSLDEIMSGLPAAMLVSQAGVLDLSTGLDMLIKGMNSTGTEFKDAEKYVNEWTAAANSSATNIGEMGEMFRTLSASARFADTTQELFTMAGAMANASITGTQAGTMLRGIMLRLAAPAATAEKAMGELYTTLGATQEEAAALAAEFELDYENAEEFGDSAKAMAQLEKIGFSAYDEAGNLKPYVQIWHELYDAVNMLDEKGENGILKQLFGQRNIAGAEAIFAAIENGTFDKLYATIGEKSGGEYAQGLADTMMSGLDGSIKILESRIEALKLKVGDVLSPVLIDINSAIGEFVNSIAGMDPEILGALTGALTGIAGLGTALAGITAVTKLIGKLSFASGGALALAAAIGAIDQLMRFNAEQAKENNFGSLALDMETLSNAVASITTAVDERPQAIREYLAGIDQAQKDYAGTLGQMSELMMVGVLSGKTLTEAEKTNLQQYGEDLLGNLIAGIDSAKKSDTELWSHIITWGSENGLDQGSANFISQLTAAGYGGLEEQAKALGEELRGLMVEALEDDVLNEDELNAIRATQQRMSRIMAEVSNMQAQEDYYVQLEKMNSLSFDTFEDFVTKNNEKQSKAISDLENERLTVMARAMMNYDYALEHGTEFTDINGNTYRLTPGEAEGTGAHSRQNVRDMVNEYYDAMEHGIRDKYSGINTRALDMLMAGSNYANAWGFYNYLYGAGADMVGEDLTGYLSAYAEANGLDAEAISKIGEEALALNDFLSTATGGLNSYTFGALIDMLMGGSGPIGVLYNELGQFDANKAAYNVNVAVDNLYGSIESSINEAASYASEHGINMSSFTGGVKSNWKNYALGGRAVSASIFGEAGPEWAIPEEHSRRTAELLDAARRASGFSWGELISMYGGLNASASHSTVTLTYAPTINAGDARGVAELLEKDKERLKRFLMDALEEGQYKQNTLMYA